MATPPTGYASVDASMRSIVTMHVDQFSTSGREFLAAVSAARITPRPGARSLSTTQLSCPFADLYDGVSESRQPQWSTVMPIGRSEGIKVYGGSSNRTVPLTLKFRWMSGDDVSSIYTQVQQPVDLLAALTSSFLTTSGRYMPPPPVIASIPGISERFRCIVESVDIRWLSPWWTSPANDILPTGADASVVLTQVSEGSLR